MSDEKKKPKDQPPQNPGDSPKDLKPSPFPEPNFDKVESNRDWESELRRRKRKERDR
jgi:hypothetical protein